VRPRAAADDAGTAIASASEVRPTIEVESTPSTTARSAPTAKKAAAALATTTPTAAAPETPVNTTAGAGTPAIRKAAGKKRATPPDRSPVLGRRLPGMGSAAHVQT
jgi:hypothetical protein